MNLFTQANRLKKYTTVYEIIDDYYNIRYLGYNKRKKFMLNLLEYQLKLLTNKARFILEQCDDKIDLRKKKKEQVIALLKEGNYDVMDNDEEYKYLRGMRIEQVEEENVAKLLKDKDTKMAEYNILKKTTLKEMWKRELKELKGEFEKYQRARRVRQYGKKGKKK